MDFLEFIITIIIFYFGSYIINLDINTLFIGLTLAYIIQIKNRPTS